MSLMSFGGRVEPGSYAVSAAAGGPPTSGTDAPLAGAEEAAAEFQAHDATCASLSAATASAGKIDLEEIDGEHAKGTFEVTFPSGKLEGSFDATLCMRTSTAGPPGGGDGTTGPRCVQ